MERQTWRPENHTTALTPEGDGCGGELAAMNSSVPGLSRLSKSDQRALEGLLTNALV
jgi:hypothetical protein